MDRFAAYLLLKRLLRDAAHRRRARIVASAMERLAARLGHPEEEWAAMGLLMHLDIALTAQNPEARGRVARELAEVEGLSPRLGETLERWAAAVDDPRPLEHALRLCDRLAEHAEVSDLPKEIELLRQRGDAAGDRLDAALEELGLSAEEASELFGEAVRSEETPP
jgi:predicted hydrolase (HD superfamily)